MFYIVVHYMMFYLIGMLYISTFSFYVNAFNQMLTMVCLFDILKENLLYYTLFILMF